MSRHHLTSTSRALFRVFVAPNLSPRFPLPTPQTPILPRAAPLLPTTSIRTKVGGRKPVKRQALSDLFTFDSAISAHTIDLIDQNGVFTPNIPIDDALRRMNRITHHLLQIRAPVTDEFDYPLPDARPVCKIITKIDLRAKYNRQLELEKNREKGPVLKNLELNWAIAGGDLKHRLEKLKGFLRQGRKVEILLGPKRRGRKATEKECKDVLKAVTDAVDEVKGASEVKREGVLGGVLTIVLQGRKLEEEQKSELKEEEVTGKAA